MFVSKIGEHRVLHGVYYIPALHNSIMSLGQLDEGGSKVEIDKGVLPLRIWDRRGRLLVKVRRGPNRLYVSNSRWLGHSASPRVEMMKHGAGMSDSAISNSRRCTSWARRPWPAGCQ